VSTTKEQKKGVKREGKRLTQEKSWRAGKNDKKKKIQSVETKKWRESLKNQWVHKKSEKN